jgi:hypothetical protein
MYSENIITFKNTIVKYVDFDKNTIELHPLIKHLRKKLIPCLENKLALKNLTFTKLQLISLCGENQFYNSNCFNHCNNDLKSFTCLYFFQNTKINIIPHKDDSEYKAMKAYKYSYVVECLKNTCIYIPSHYAYCFDNISGHVLQIYDIISKSNYDSYIEKLLVVEVNKNTFIEHFCKRLGLCYNNKMHFIYHWIHFLQYVSIRNDFQFKLCLTDLKPEQKVDHIICYENRPRMLADKKNKYYNFNEFIIIDTNIQHIVPDNYYLFQFIKIMILCMVITVVVIFYKDVEIRQFLKKRPTFLHQ